MSLLVNYSDQPAYKSVTVQSDYQWNDYLSIVLALGWADLSAEAANLPLMLAEQTVALQVKFEF